MRISTPMIACLLMAPCLCSAAEWPPTTIIDHPDQIVRLQRILETPDVAIVEDGRDILQVGPDLPEHQAWAASLSVTNAAIRLDGQTVTLQDPADKPKKAVRVHRWDFSVEAPGDYAIHIHDQAQVALLDGSPLRPSDRGLWTRQGGVGWIELDQGPHTLIALPAEADDDLLRLHIVQRDGSAAALHKAIAGHIAEQKGETDDETEDIVEAIAGGPGARAKDLWPIVDRRRQEIDDGELDRVGRFCRTILAKLPADQQTEFLDGIQDRGRDLFLATLFDQKLGWNEWRFLQDIVSSTAITDADLAESIIVAFLDHARKASDKDEDFRKHFDGRAEHLIMDQFITSGELERTQQLYERLVSHPLSDIKPADSQRTRDRLSLMRRNASKLAGSPEAAVRALEFSNLLEREGDVEQRSGKALELLIAAKGLLHHEGFFMRNLRRQLEIALLADDQLRATVQKLAARRLATAQARALASGDLESIAELADTYAGIADTSQLHRALVDQHLDRGNLSRARFHLQRLIEIAPPGMQAQAVIERAFVDRQLGIEERIPENRTWKDKEVRRAGSVHRYAELSRDESNQSRGLPSGQPGAVRSSLTLPPYPNSFALPDDGNDPEDLPIPRRQPITPARIGDLVILPGSDLIRAYHRDGNLAWQFGDHQSPRSLPWMPLATQFTVTAFGNDVLACLRDGREMVLFRIAPDGEEIWRSDGAPQNKRWEPLCAPHVALGSVVTLLQNREAEGEIQIAIAEVDPATGAFSDITPLHSVPKDDDLGQAVLFGSRFCDDGEAIYGLTGLGAVFRYHPGRRSLDWLRSWPIIDDDLDRDKSQHACFITAEGNRVVAGSTALDRWVGLDALNGQVAWLRNQTADQFVVRGTVDGAHFVLRHIKGHDPLVISYDILTGQQRWATALPGAFISGDGAIGDSRLAIPCTDGVAVLSRSTGAWQEWLPTPEPVQRIAALGTDWALLTAERCLITDNDGQLTASFPEMDDSTDKADDSQDHDSARLPMGRLALHLRIPQPLPSQRHWDAATSIRPLPFPDTYLASGRDSLAVIHDAPKPTIRHLGRYPGLASDDQGFISWQGHHLDLHAFPDGRHLWRWLPPLAIFGRSRDDMNIENAALGPTEVFLQFDDGVVLVLDRTDASIKERLQLPDRHGLVDGDEEVLILDHRRNRICVKRDDLKEVVWEHKHFDARIVGTSTIGFGRDWFVWYDNRSGFGRKGRLNRDHDGSWLHLPEHGLVAIGREQLVTTDPDAKAPEQPIEVLIDRSAGALAIYEKHMDWYPIQGDKAKLAAPPKRLVDHLGGDVPPPLRVQEGRAHIGAGTLYVVLDLGSGEPLHIQRLVSPHHRHHDGIRAILSRHLVLGDDVWSFVGSPQASRGIHTIPVAHLPEVDEGAWPAEGWFPFTAPSDWTGAEPEGATPQYRFGINGGRFYAEWALPANSASDIHLDLDWPHSSNKRTTLTWYANGNGPRFTGLADGTARSWKVAGPDGRQLRRVMIDLEANHGLSDLTQRAPMIRNNIVQRQRGEEVRRFIVGGMVGGDIGTHAIPENRLIIGQPESDFSQREALFAESTNFLPQGVGLTNWLDHRRVIHGSDDNMAFLEGMLERCSASPAAANIMGALIVEKVEVLRRQGADQLSEEFYDAVQQISAEVDELAAKHEVPENIRSRGSSVVMAGVHPVAPADRSIFEHAPFFAHSEKRHSKQPFPAHRHSWAAWPQSLPHSMLMPCGLFSGRAPAQIDRIDFAQLEQGHALIGPVILLQPDGQKHIIDREAKNAEQVEREEQWGQRTRGAFNGRRFIALQVEDRHKRNDLAIRTPPLPVGPAPEGEDLSAENLMLALRNLPSTSDIGFHLIDAYQEAVGDDAGALSREDCYELMLEQIGHRGDVVENAANRLWNHFQDQPRLRRLKSIHELFQKANVSRTLQQRALMPFTNTLQEPKEWLKLGPVTSEIELDRQPHRVEGRTTHTYEDVDSDQTWRFEKVPTERHGEIDLPRAKEADRVVWLAVDFELLDDEKVFLYLDREHRGRRTQVVDIWVDGASLAEGETFERWDSHFVTEFVRLDKGKHQITMRVLYAERFDIRLSLADSWGVPLETLRLIPPPGP